MSEQWVLLGIAIAAASGIPGLFLSRSSNTGQYVATALAVIGSVFGLSGVGAYWWTGDSQPIVRPWAIPGAEFHVAIDGLSALFLVPIFLVSMLGSIYGLGYWKQTEHPQNGRKLRLFYGLLPAGMALLVIARNSILFMVGWEIMALSAFFLVTTEDHDRQVRETGWIYLVSTKVATLSLFALFALLRTASGSYTLTPLNGDTLTHGMATAIFVFTVVGFGLKAGMMPFRGVDRASGPRITAIGAEIDVDVVKRPVAVRESDQVQRVGRVDVHLHLRLVEPGEVAHVDDVRCARGGRIRGFRRIRGGAGVGRGFGAGR